MVINNLIGGTDSGLVLTDIEVNKDSWVLDSASTFIDFSYKTEIKNADITEDQVLTLFVPDHTNKAIQGIFCPYCNTTNGSLNLYANCQPETFNIELLRFESGVI